jgi:tetratricopeptide (TPR) repeat protein
MEVWSQCLAILAFFLVLPAASARNPQDKNLNDRFQAAVAKYDSGKYAEAAAELESLVLESPDSFEVHELLGMVYSAESEDAKANLHFEKAVLLKPNSAAARTNLATNLSRLGKLEEAGAQFRKAAKLEPRNFDANHNMGEFYVHSGKIADAVPYLERAQRNDPSSYDNGYDLSLAYSLTGRLDDALKQVRALLEHKNTAELHNLLGEIEEKGGNFLAAAKEYQIAARMDPSESNLFDWGSELLLHNTLEPAVQVFQQGTLRYPRSPRMAIGFGLALYFRGRYDEAVRSLMRAADLNPSDSRCYPFLSEAYESSPSQADEVIQRFRHFAELQPQNGRAFYYYAMSLWKGKRAQDLNLDFPQIESLLKTSIFLDPYFAEAHLQLGNLYFDQSKYADSIPEYLQAVKFNSDLADAHYRLARAYVRVHQMDHAKEQLQVYQKLSEQQHAEVDKQRAEIRQFVYSAKRAPETKP